jgi:hypothetical protein
MDIELSPSLVAEADKLSAELIEWILTKLYEGTRPVPLHWALAFATAILSGDGEAEETSLDVFRAANKARDADGLERLGWQSWPAYQYEASK